MSSNVFWLVWSHCPFLQAGIRRSLTRLHWIGLWCRDLRIRWRRGQWRRRRGQCGFFPIIPSGRSSSSSSNSGASLSLSVCVFISRGLDSALSRLLVSRNLLDPPHRSVYSCAFLTVYLHFLWRRFVAVIGGGRRRWWRVGGGDSGQLGFMSGRETRSVSRCRCPEFRRPALLSPFLSAIRGRAAALTRPRVRCSCPPVCGRDGGE